MQVIGYGRVSTEEQAASGLGLDAQREAILDEATRRGWTVHWRQDEACSGKQVNASLRRSLDELRSGQAEALVVAKMDRLTRSLVHAADVLAAAKTQGWNLVVLDLGVDLATPQGRAMAQMLAVFAELERELIGQRTRDALASARRRGVQLGRPRLASPSVVRRIAMDREAGQSFSAIARALTAEGVLSPAGRPTWQDSSVRRIYNATKEMAA